MSLPKGTRLGRYEVHSLIGAGGMGEVYRAADTRIGRDVAIKVLPADFSSDPEHRRRFEHEARAAGALNHPNILSLYDIGTTPDGLSYVVSELLEGETLREHMGGNALPRRKAVRYALQIAQGLAAAHEKGIVHRDLKPENLFVTRDGRVKILDFGLAKLDPVPGAESPHPEAPTMQAKTAPGMVVGTAGYMSPEQVRAAPIDHRSDIFSLGSILYEMLTGRRAFKGESFIETMSAILREDPPGLSEAGPDFNPALQHVVRHCLEKNPEQRFQSARDLAFDLELISTGLTESVLAAATPAQARGKRPGLLKGRVWPLLAAALVLAALLPAAFYVGRRAGERPLPTYRPLTFRRGTIWTARFAPDGQTLFYSATWGGNPTDVYAVPREGTESRALGHQNAQLLAVSQTGEMALLVKTRHLEHYTSRGTLARMPAGGAPREMLEDVLEADWSPDGSQLAVVLHKGGLTRVEFPVGRLLHETAGWVSHARVSPKGDRVAFLDHPVQWDDRGHVTVVDLEGKKQVLTGEWGGAEGLAWAPGGGEVWFTASKAGEAQALYAVTLGKQERVVARAPVSLMIHDISRDGRVLVARGSETADFFALPPGELKERDVSWLDRGGVRDISADGRRFVFSQWGEGSGVNYAVYTRETDGSPAVRLGDGAAWALSPDGKKVLAILSSPPEVVLLPTGAGESRRLPRHGIERYGLGASWLPDGNSVLFIGLEPGRQSRCYVQAVEGDSPPRPVTPEGFTGHLVSPDGAYVVVTDPANNRVLYPLREGEEPRAVLGLDAQDQVIRWAADGRSLYVYKPRELPVRVSRLDLTTGRKESLRDIMPTDPTGIVGPIRLYLTPDGRGHVYDLRRSLSSLYLAEGLL